MSNSVPDLIIPVYLNQRMVFDLVAMLQGGIATVTRVSEAQRDSDKTSEELTGGFGLSQALSSLLRVSLAGKLGAESENSLERTTASERVHTPASLLFTLRNLLFEKNVLRPHSKESPPKPGEFVEFTASLRRNPLIEGLDSVVELLDIAAVFSDPTKQGQGGGKKGGAQGQGDLKHLRGQLESLSTSLKAWGTQDLVADLLPTGGRALLTVEDKFLNDPSLSNLIDGTFRVIGKVIRSVDDSKGSISLLRKTAMSRLPPGMLQTLTGSLASLQQNHGFTMPAMEVEVKGPVFQLLPLAIFA